MAGRRMDYLRRLASACLALPRMAMRMALRWSSRSARRSLSVAGASLHLGCGLAVPGSKLRLGLALGFDAGGGIQAGADGLQFQVEGEDALLEADDEAPCGLQILGAQFAGQGERLPFQQGIVGDLLQGFLVPGTLLGAKFLGKGASLQQHGDVHFQWAEAKAAEPGRWLDPGRWSAAGTSGLRSGGPGQPGNHPQVPARLPAGRPQRHRCGGLPSRVPGSGAPGVVCPGWAGPGRARPRPSGLPSPGQEAQRPPSGSAG